jgi:AcrR family transcriptional regulator
MDASQGPLTAKAVETRGQILTAALDLFASKGYRATTMRDIAQAAGVSLGLAYRYFSSKEDLLIAFYERCAVDLRSEIDELPRSSSAQRYTSVLRKVMLRLTPYRESFAEMGGVYLNPRDDVGVLSDKLAPIRAEGCGLFKQVLAGASDAAPARTLDDLATLAYAGYFMLLLFWVNDTTDDQAATEKLLLFVEDMISRFRLLLRIHIFVRYCNRLADIIRPMFIGK